MNKVNLQKMADHIKTIPQEMFDMADYRNNINDRYDVECGSIGCVIGHCVQLDPAQDKIPRENGDGSQIAFTKWSTNFTGLFLCDDEWNWCFSSHWRFPDNTPIGASKRIEYLINHGLPENWVGQMYGSKKLCY